MIQSIKYIICTVVLATVIGTVSGQKVMTLEECRKQAVEFNKELKNAALQKQETKAYQKAARTAYLPAISASVSLTHRPNMEDFSIPGNFLSTADNAEDAENEIFTGQSDVWNPGMSMEMNSLTLINGGVTVSQPVYTGGKIKYSNKQADAGVEISDLSLNLKYSEVIEQTDIAFWNVTMVEANIDVAEKYIEMLNELESQMEAMYEVGLQPASEKLRVSVQKNEAKLNLLKAKNGLKISKMHLNLILGQDLDTDIQISHNSNANVQLFNLEGGTNLASANRNELKILAKQKTISEYDAKLTRADYLPQVGISAQYSSFYVKDLLEEVSFKPMLAAQVSIPIFQWGQGKHKQRAAQLKIEQAQINIQHTNDLINLEVMQIQVQVQEAFESITIAKKNIAEAKESLEETRASFDVGLNTTTELLDSQANWIKAQGQLIEEIAHFNVLETKWKKVTGSLYIPK